MTRFAPNVVVHSKLKDFVITISVQLNLKLELGLDCEHFSYSQFGFRMLKVLIVAK